MARHSQNIQQYHTERPERVPVLIAERHGVRHETFPNVAAKLASQVFPHPYHNDPKPTMASWETRHERLYEIPVTMDNHYDPGKKTFALKTAKNRETVKPGDRRRVVSKPVNDPGPYRCVGRVDESSNRFRPQQGLIYHPTDDPQGFKRAVLEPRDRDGNRTYNRYVDDHDNLNRVSTWPPRDQDGDNLAEHKRRYRQVRKPQARKPMRY